MSNVTIIVGAQWGDEGKGKWIDALASEADIVARFQGGNNAGHTLYIQGKKVVLHQIPSGIFHQGTISAITSGVVFNPVEILKEIKEVAEFVPVNSERLWLSDKTHVITPWTIYLDKESESSTKNPIGTTKKGIGPTYAEKSKRIGLRIGEFIDKTSYDAWLDVMNAIPEFKSFYSSNKDLWSQFEESAPIIREFVCDAEALIRKAVKEGKKLLLEGAQGTLLDINHGTYPFVTSSSTTAGGAIASLGISPKSVGSIVGIAKAYATRVGEGPFPTHLKDDVGAEIARKGHEFGATTNRPRKCGWYDAVAMRYACEVNGMDGIYLNKIDILTNIETLKIAVAYIHPKLGRITEFPTNLKILEECEPEYVEYPGWNEEIPSGKTFNEIPVNAQKFIREIERLTETKVIMIGSGPGREDYVTM